MANGDIIDTMLGWIFQLMGWIIRSLLGLILGFLKFLFQVVKSLITKKDFITSQDNSHLEGVDPRKVKELYESVLQDLTDNAADTSLERAEYLLSFIRDEVMTNLALSVEQKCVILERVNVVLDNYNPKLYNRYFTKLIFGTYKILNSIESSELLFENFYKFQKELENNKLQSFRFYILDLFRIAGVLGSASGKFSLDSNKILGKYNLPEMKGNVE